MYGGGADIGLAIGGTLIQHYSWHAGSWSYGGRRVVYVLHVFTF